MEDNIIGFLGRLHPLIVHLPIGILLLAGLMQMISLKSKIYFNKLNPAISFALLCGGITSFASILIGWLLSLQGGYDNDTLFWHKWLGVLLVLLTFFAWALKANKIRLHKLIFYFVFSLIIILVAVSGHLGGNLTHGKTYLTQYAPKFIKKIVGIKEDIDFDLKEIHQDSIKVFPHLIQPLLDKKCISCHGSTKKDGGLLLTGYEEIIYGGDHGTIMNTKNPFESELLNRVTLPKTHKKFMPPKGSPLTFGEIQLVKWWMKSGADSVSKFSLVDNLDVELIHTLQRDYQLDFNPKPYYEKVKVDSLPNSVILELQKNQFLVDLMGEKSNMISITFKGDSINNEQLEKLLLAKHQITWLSLSNCKMTDERLKILKNFQHITRLNLHSNPITDDNIKELIPLKHLKLLNLYNTKISRNSINDLIQLESLSKLYVWKTSISNLEIQEISNKYSHIEIIGNLN